LQPASALPAAVATLEESKRQAMVTVVRLASRRGR
jgi:hypothetical protein